MSNKIFFRVEAEPGSRLIEYNDKKRTIIWADKETRVFKDKAGNSFIIAAADDQCVVYLTRIDVPSITPGPWYYKKELEIGSFDFVIYRGRLPYAKGFREHFARVNEEADAKAIAQVPNMISFLQGIVDERTDYESAASGAKNILKEIGL